MSAKHEELQAALKAITAILEPLEPDEAVRALVACVCLVDGDLAAKVLRIWKESLACSR